MEIKVERKGQIWEFPYDLFVGFTKIAELEWSHRSYEFDLSGVWRRDSDGTLWTADDSGCSCPSPWDRVDTLTRLYSFEPFEERRKQQIKDIESFPGYGGVIQAEWDDFKATVEAFLQTLSHQ
jgi:hypothetical protein